jgi:hypothetical protein
MLGYAWIGGSIAINCVSGGELEKKRSTSGFGMAGQSILARVSGSNFSLGVQLGSPIGT